MRVYLVGDGDESYIDVNNFEDQQDLRNAINSNKTWVELYNRDVLININQISCITEYSGGK